MADITRSLDHYTALVGLTLLCLACNGGNDTLETGPFRVAILADTHIIDEFYTGDEKSIYKTETYLTEARTMLHNLSIPPKVVFICGDFVHNYPSDDWDFYFEQQTRWDIAKNLISEFQMSVYPGLGNHDYDIDKVSRDFTHRLFKDKFGIAPYYSVEIHGFKFIHVNNLIEPTWDAAHKLFNTGQGSLGKEQLQWLQAELAEGMPSIIMLHFGLFLIEDNEAPGEPYPDLKTLIWEYQDNIHLVLSGHTHMWMDFHQKYGPQHYVIAAVRYNPHSWMLLDIDPERNQVTFTNKDKLILLSENTEPYEGP